MNQKPLLREQFLSRRMALSEAEQVRRSASVCNRVESLIGPNTNEIWTTYFAVRGEVNPDLLHSSLQVRWAFPVVERDHLRFFIPYGQSSFRRGPFGILEPRPELSEEVTAEEISGCLVPAIAFDRRGHRLGSGKGYYDRFLSQFSGKTVGLGYDFQVIDQLPVEPTDIPVKYVVTEKEILAVKGGKE